MKDSPQKKAYDTAYENRPEQVKKRELRNKARTDALKAGTAHKGDHTNVDHVKPLGAGGSNAKSNLRVIDESRNKGWRKGEAGYKPKKV